MRIQCEKFDSATYRGKDTTIEPIIHSERACLGVGWLRQISRYSVVGSEAGVSGLLPLMPMIMLVLMRKDFLDEVLAGRRRTLRIVEIEYG